MNYWENLQILPLGNVRLFAEFAKMTHFSENVRVSFEFSEFLGKSTNSTLGKRASFRRMHKNDVMFLKMCVFRKHLVNVSVFR